MKKLISLVLVLALSLCSVAALAESAPSVPLFAVYQGDVIINKVEDMDVDTLLFAVQQLANVVSAPSLQDYFGDAAEGKDVDQFCPVKLQEAEGDVALLFVRAEPFTAEEEVVVMIGVQNGNDVAWTACDDVVINDNGTLTVTVPADLAAAMLANPTVVAVLTKAAA